MNRWHHRMSAVRTILLAAAVWLAFCWAVASGADAAARARRDRIIRHHCQENAWRAGCWAELGRMP